MARTISSDTKFATINVTRCSAADDFGDPTLLGNGLSVHRAPLFELGADFDRDIGWRSAEEFRTANFVLMASARSNAPTIRDEQWHRLDQRVFMLFYAILMHGIPNFWAAKIASGGMVGDRPVVLHFSTVPPIYRTADALPPRVDAVTLHGADAAVRGLITVYEGTEYRRVRRGLNALIAAWKQEGVTDRLHGYVRAIDALMKLPQGRSRVEFIRRVPVFATATRITDIADALYHLRSYDEHLSDWPRQLAHIAVGNRPRFVAQHAFYAESLAGFAFRTLLVDPMRLGLFRTDADIDELWSGGHVAWTQRIELDVEQAQRFRYRGP